MLATLLLAVALAMDATAVAAARSVSGTARRDLFALAVAFGVFQAGMAALGLALGSGAAQLVARWDHWLAFGLLSLIGAKMFVDAWREEDVEPGSARTGARLGLRTIVALSIATSIDALAAGVTLPTLGTPPAFALASIGAASFALSGVGALLGAALGAHLGRKLEVFGGLVLIGIGLRTLLEHLG